MLIGVDWGTTNLRAHLIDDDGAVVRTVRSDKGLMNVPAGGFESALGDALSGLHDRPANAPVVMSGMVGSRQGWVEAPYVAPPADAGTLAAQTVSVDAPTIGTVFLVPGVAVGIDGGEWADVMRGEETEILGALVLTGRTGGTFVMPGTHSKWVEVVDGAIAGFRTYMTGDVFAAVGGHTILSRFSTDTFDDAAFLKGLDMASGLDAPGDILTRLFTIRAEILMGRFSEASTRGALSGLLIGAELLSGAARGGPIVIVGASDVARSYADAAAHLGIEAELLREEAAPHGHALIARALQSGPRASS